MNQPVLIAIVAFAVLLVVRTIIQNRNYCRRMHPLAAVRSGGSICGFVRSLPYILFSFCTLNLGVCECEEVCRAYFKVQGMNLDRLN